ncbi:MAG: hypothetical protein HYS13_04745 [Planctomycetia bacterium]|nr:hypothetical protein [Planctomycetia bacterium]
MLKKSLIAGGILVVLAAFFFGWDAWSYITTGAEKLQGAVRDNVPIEFELERARKMARDLTPVINDNKHRIAQEEVAVELLASRMAKLEDKIGKDRSEIVALKTDLEKEHDFYVYAGRTYSQDDVTQDLSRRFDRLKTNDAQLTSMKKMHDARRRSLDATRQKLEGMVAAKRQLEAEIENLNARLEMVRAAETAGEFTFDDSALARVKGLVGDLEQRIEVMAKVADQEVDAYAEIPVTQPGSPDVLEQVNAYLGGNTQIVLNQK